MRPRSLSVAYDKSGMMSKKFEGVTSDHEDDSNSDDETVTDVKSEFSLADYEKLVLQIRAVVPNNDTKKAEYRLKNLDWANVAFDDHSPDTVRDVSLKLFKSIRRYRTLEEVLNDFIMVSKKIILAGKPKAPLSAFNFFLREHLPAYKQKHPELTHRSLFGKVAEEYKLISIKKKRKYEQLAEEARAVYKVELEKFYKENPSAIGTKRKKAPTGEKKSPARVTPFSLFRTEKKNEGLKLSQTELKALWEKLEFDQKMKYIRKGYSIDKSNLTKDEKVMMATALGKPDFVPKTAFEYYLRNHIDKDNTISVIKWRRQAAIDFKKLPRVSKLEVELEMRRARADYVKKYQEYIDNLPTAEKQVEIDFLQAYIASTMDKEEKKSYNCRPIHSLSGCGGHSLHDITDLPIAESTTHEIAPTQKKKSKKKAIPEPTTSNDESKPLKSILKSPARTPVVATPKRKTDDVQASTNATPTKKKKSDQVQVVVDSESDSNAKKGKKKAKKEKESDDGVDSSQGKLKNGTREDHIPIKEPKRPPKDILKYYKKFHYFGREGKHKESFDKLSNIRKKSIEAEMRAAQKKYMVDLKTYLDLLPPSEVQSYVTKLKQFVTDVGSADEADSDDVDENFRKSSSLGKTKREPTSDSDDDDNLSDD